MKPHERFAEWVRKCGGTAAAAARVNKQIELFRPGAKQVSAWSIKSYANRHRAITVDVAQAVQMDTRGKVKASDLLLGQVLIRKGERPVRGGAQQ